MKEMSRFYMKSAPIMTKLAIFFLSLSFSPSFPSFLPEKKTFIKKET